ncbi:exodeoxyribonuclease III [Sandarakinorhabdus limnophila]|uniref:exodeoxyribonuclease III n=1 Tax=Sandarakinorhabdus limnophila TaxID=210512 RepID=UPI0003B59E61|nr:exodeoxyribonuclease III [Sandarakinorhabdus limnophila]
MSLRIATWNINSVRARADIVEQFLRGHQPDVLCLQETKVANDIFPHGLFEQLGYTHRILNGQRMHHGVATISRVPLEGAWRYDWQDNGEARHIGVRLPNGVLLENVYVPAGGDVPDREVNPKFGQKMDFIERMTRWSEGLKEPAVIVGDFNVAPQDCDVWNHKALLDVVSHTPMEVDALNRLQQSHDWVDLGRHFNPAPEKFFTWWSYRNIDWRLSDRGRRLDHIWASPSVAKQATGFEAVRDARDWGKPSDHIPQIVTLDL